MRFYVYALIDPRTNAQFYIGKGQKQRAWAHEKCARRGQSGKKNDFIREIIAENLVPIVQIIQRFDKEQDAYKFEKKLIREKRGTLLNITHGGCGGLSGDFVKYPVETDKAIAKGVGKFIRDTDNFTKPPIVLWGTGQPIELPKDVIDMAKAQLKRLMDKYGANWFKEQTGIVYA